MKLFWCFVFFLSGAECSVEHRHLANSLSSVGSWLGEGWKSTVPFNRNMGQFSCISFSLSHCSVPIILEPRCLAQPLCCYKGTMAKWLAADICTQCEQYLLNMASSQQQSIPLRRISWPGTKLEWLYHTFLLSLVLYLKWTKQLYAPTDIKAWIKDLPAG